MRGDFSGKFGIRRRRAPAFLWLVGQTGRIRNLAYAQHDLGDQFRSGFAIDLGQQRWLQERELLEPDGVPHHEIQLLEPDLIRPGMGGDGLTEHLAPPVLEAEFEEPGFQTKAFRQS
jgi:hypothetical protein